MATNVLLPQWGMNMEDGTLVKWLVKEGDPVSKGQPLVEVETAKINSELESPVEGIVAHLMSDEGTVVKVGAVVVVIAAPGENAPRPEVISSRRANRSGLSNIKATGGITKGQTRTQITPIARRLAKDNDIDIDQLSGSGPNDRITEGDVRKAISQRRSGPPITTKRQIVPKARELARGNGIDIDTVVGTGPHGRVMVTDVEQAIRLEDSTSDFGDAVTESTRLSGLRKVISERMTLSVRSMAQVTLTTEIDATELVNMRETLVAQWRSHKIRPMDQDIIIAAVGDALVQHPRLNSYLQDDTVMLLRDVNIGVAMAVKDGLVVPVVSLVNEISLLDIAKRLRSLALKARDSSLSMDDMSGAGFTVTSLSNYDIDVFTPLVDPPQVAIMGVGRISPKPVVINDEISVRRTMHISVTFDHRALDGVPVAEFIRTAKSNIESPEWLSNRALEV